MAEDLRPRKILVVEDSEGKWRDIQRQLSMLADRKFQIERAATVEEADAKIATRDWNLILLDISMDIRASASGPRAGGHDTVGGLKIAERMYYLGHDAPVLIVTAFDAFPSGAARGNAMLGLQDIIREASDILGDYFVGWVRYGVNGWEETFRDKVNEALGK